MSPAKKKRRRKKKTGAGGAGAWTLGILLAVVLVLFLASQAGWLGGGEAPPPTWAEEEELEIPSRPLGLPADDKRGDEGFIGQVSRLAREVRARSSADRAVDESVATAIAPATSEPVRVFLANGCGVNRLAARMTPLVRDGGFDVCGVSGADREDYDETLVIDRCGDRRKAQVVCDYFRRRWGVGRVLLQSRAAPDAEVLVVLGRDIEVGLQRGR